MSSELVDRKTISLVINCLLLVSTLVGSDFFGIPQYIALNTAAPNLNRMQIFLWGMFYFFGFFFVQLYFATMYIFKLLSGVIYSVRDGVIHPPITKCLLKEKNAITSLVSMVLALSWCLGIYESTRDINNDQTP